MVTTITIPFRFRGPPTSGNGGVSAGLLATRLGASVTVRLRRPPPLDTPLTVEENDGDMTASQGDELVLLGRRAALDLEPPLDESMLRRTVLRGVTPVPADWAAPECFVCGPRSDGLGVCPHHLAGTEVWTTVWVPRAAESSNGVTVDEHIIWGVLDCPAGIAVTRAGLEPLQFFPALTDLTVEIRQPVAVGEPVIVTGWKVGETEKRVDGGTAVVRADGSVLAIGHARHARLPIDFAA